LLIAHQTTYDPTAWLIWGREILDGDLSTRVGPSWKPLPILVTAPAALLGDPAQQHVWLLVARAGTACAVVLAHRLGYRLGGPIAGTIAACSLLVSTGFTSREFRGNSEGLLVAAALGAVEAHLAGRRRAALALLVAAALMRPELSLFVAAYGLWLAHAAPAGRRHRCMIVVAVAGALIVAAWLVPEKIGSGQVFRAASRALLPVPGSPALAEHPFLATFTNAAPVLPWPLYAAGVALVALAIPEARRTRKVSLALALAVIATALMAIAAAMAQAGFSGNTRYLTIPIAISCVLGGAGCTRVASAIRARLSAGRATVAMALAVAVAAPFVVHAVDRAHNEMRGALRESALYAALPDVIARAGGRAAVLRCGALSTGPFDTQAVARALGAHQTQVGLRPRLPGTIIARRGSSLAGERGYVTVARNRRWVVGSSCLR